MGRVDRVRSEQGVGNPSTLFTLFTLSTLLFTIDLLKILAGFRPALERIVKLALRGIEIYPQSLCFGDTIRLCIERRVFQRGRAC